MTQNILFNFIAGNLVSLEKAFQTQNISLREDVNLKDHPYYRIELPHQVLILDSKESAFRLEDHHISVYHIEKSDTPSLSQYHYTAYFSDRDGHFYQLHVYFNAEDQLTMQPVFAIKDRKSGRFSPIASEHLEEQFVSLATSNIEPIIGLLRKQLSDKVSSLSASYRQLETHACSLSQNMHNEPKGYLKVLIKIEKALTLLIPLAPNDGYGAIKGFIHQIKLNVEQLCSKSSNPPKPVSVNQKEAKPIKAKAPQNSKTESVSAKKGAHQRQLSTSFNQEIKSLDLALSKLPTADNQPAHLNQIYSSTYQQAVLLEFESKKPSLESLIKLKQLHNSVHSAGENLLHSLLKEGKFAQAKELQSFFYILDVDQLNKALRTRNHGLLDFLLSTNNFMINTQPIVIKGVTYPSAVHYCFSRHSKDTPMQDCLAVLIKHGASVLVKGGDGLPIAHTILNGPQHPLKTALDANTETTLESIRFYKQLVVELNRYLKENRVEDAQRQELLESIQRYQFYIERLMAAKELVPAKKQHNMYLEKLSALRLKYNSGKFNELIRKVENDNDLMKLSSILFQEYAVVLRKVPLHLRTKLGQEISKSLDEIEGFLAAVTFEDDGFPTVKESVLEHLRSSLENTRKMDRLIAINEKLKRPIYSKNAQSHSSKLVSEQKRLQAELSLTPFKHAVASLSRIESTLEEMQSSLQSLTVLLEGFNSIAQGKVETECLSQIDSTLQETRSSFQSFTSFFDTQKPALAEGITQESIGQEGKKAEETLEKLDHALASLGIFANLPEGTEVADIGPSNSSTFTPSGSSSSS